MAKEQDRPTNEAGQPVESAHVGTKSPAHDLPALVRRIEQFTQAVRDRADTMLERAGEFVVALGERIKALRGGQAAQPDGSPQPQQTPFQTEQHRAALNHARDNLRGLVDGSQGPQSLSPQQQAERAAQSPQDPAKQQTFDLVQLVARLGLELLDRVVPRTFDPAHDAAFNQSGTPRPGQTAPVGQPTPGTTGSVSNPSNAPPFTDAGKSSEAGKDTGPGPGKDAAKK